MTVLGFTRPVQRLEASVSEAECMGFRVIAAPSLEIMPGDESEFLRLESSLEPGVPVIFGSSTAVEQCSLRFGERLPSMLSETRVISIGPATTRSLEKVGVRVDSVPEDFSSYGLVELLRDDVRNRRVIIVRSDSGTDILSDGLRDSGADLVDIASYRLKKVGMCPELLRMFEAIRDREMDVMAFTSPMSASSFVEGMREHFGKEADGYLKGIRLAAIGRPTSERMTSLGFPPDIVPAETTFRDMLLTIRDAS